MDKSMQPPPYNEIYPTAPPVEQDAHQQHSAMYPNVPEPGQWNQQQPYPPAGYPLIPPQQQPQMVQSQPVRPIVIINQQVIFGENPIAMTCPTCQNQILTKIEHQSNIINHGIALAMCIFGFWCCCCIPYCIDSIKDVTHKCSKCGAFLGQYRRGRV